MPTKARHWYFNARPKGEIDHTTLVLREEEIGELRDGEFLLKTLYLSLDATNRVWLSEWDIYMEPVHLGDRMLGFVVGRVVESRNPEFPVGSLATGLSTWSDYVRTDGTGFQLFPGISDFDVAEAFGILAVAGPTAVHGLLTLGQPKAGETVLVTAAAGAVGQLVGQIARIQGCRAVGVAGGLEKCRLLTEVYGYDAAVDYKQPDLVGQLRAVAPDGIDLLFENVGGEVLDAGLTVMNDFGRVVVCGLISTYNASGEVPGPYMFRNIIMRRLRMEGFVILDHMDAYPGYQMQMLEWMREGKLTYRLHVIKGLDQAVNALKLLYTGGNMGKLMVEIAAP